MLRFELSTEVVAKLTQLGFRFAELERTEAFIYEAGSIANWKRVKITPAFAECSLAHDEEYKDCVRVIVERESEAGYVEVDWSYMKSGKVVVEDLFKFLESEGISFETSRERLEKIRKAHREKQELRAKLEAAGFDVQEVERILG